MKWNGTMSPRAYRQSVRANAVQDSDGSRKDDTPRGYQMRPILIARGGLLALLGTATLTAGTQMLHAQQTDRNGDVLRQAQESAKQIEKQTGMKIPEFTPEEKKAMTKEYALGLVQAGQLCSAFKHDPSLIDSSKRMALDILVSGAGMPKAEAEAAVAAVPPQDTKPDNMLAVKIQCSMINAPIE